jgi:hypothetical protein
LWLAQGAFKKISQLTEWSRWGAEKLLAAANLSLCVRVTSQQHTARGAGSKVFFSRSFIRILGFFN